MPRVPGSGHPLALPLFLPNIRGPGRHGGANPGTTTGALEGPLRP